MIFCPSIYCGCTYCDTWREFQTSYIRPQLSEYWCCSYPLCFRRAEVSHPPACIKHARTTWWEFENLEYPVIDKWDWLIQVIDFMRTEGAYLSRVPKLKVNQCDGCRRKIPIVNGIHRGPGGFWAGDWQCCTAHLYMADGDVVETQSPEESSRFPGDPGALPSSPSK